MKKLNVMLLAAAFAVSSVVSAGTNPAKTESTLTNEIKTLLEKPSFKIKKDLTAYVTLTLNDENEIVVLSVDSKSETLESFIKHRLNYKKLNMSLSGNNKFYKVPVRLVQ